LREQIECLVAAWAWTEDDRILHFLPLHHTHGIVNKWLCAMWSGARCDMMEKFDAKEVIDRISKDEYTLFMAVPTVYAKMVESLSSLDSARDDKNSARDDKNSARDDKDSTRDDKRFAVEGKIRLMVSGSAALPVSVLQKWKEITGHTLLERYGMTETGMVLSNPLDGERRAGSVGQVLPGMQVRMVNEAGEITSDEGELQVKGRNLFSGYWNKEEETKKSFTKDKWFRTGDLVRLQDGYYYIVGRLSTDIIKSGGYKTSALEIESVLLQHPDIKECAVVGLPDETWGEKIAAAVVWKSEPLTLDELRQWLKDKLAAYKLPSVMKNCESLPRNAMAKTEKGKVKSLFED
jgi:malonyl-CoA/methylmalonyl-CoA synthetase